MTYQLKASKIRLFAPDEQKVETELLENRRILIYLMYSIMVVMSAILGSCNTDDYYEPEKTEIEDINDKTDLSDDNSEEDNPIGNHHEGKNLLKNGGLEDWLFFAPNDMPEYWLHHNNNNVEKNWKVVSEGKYSAKMQSKKTGSTATIDQNVPVEPRSMIRIRFHYYVEQWKDKGARTYCYFRTRSTESSTISVDELKAFYDKNTYYIIRGGGYGLTYLPHNLDIWQEFDEIIEVPPTATYFVFGVNSYYGTTIYIDNCSVTEIEY